MTPASALRIKIMAKVATDHSRIWTWADFVPMASREAIDNMLSRIARQDGTVFESCKLSKDWAEFFAQERLLRVDRGLYHCPRMNSLTKRPSVPSSDKIIEAVMANYGARYVVPEAVAANRLGFTPMVQTMMTVETDARLKPIGGITFVQKSVAKLVWSRRPGAVVVQGLAWVKHLMEDEGFGDEERKSVRTKLGVFLRDKPEVVEDLRSSPQALSEWTRKEIELAAKSAGLDSVFAYEEPEPASEMRP